MHIMQRGTSFSSASRPEVKNEDDSDPDNIGTSYIEDYDMIEPTACEVESTASTAVCGTIRDSILVAVTKNSAMPVGGQCLSCKCSASY